MNSMFLNDDGALNVWAIMFLSMLIVSLVCLVISYFVFRARINRLKKASPLSMEAGKAKNSASSYESTQSGPSSKETASKRPGKPQEEPATPSSSFGRDIVKPIRKDSLTVVTPPPKTRKIKRVPPPIDTSVAVATSQSPSSHSAKEKGASAKERSAKKSRSSNREARSSKRSKSKAKPTQEGKVQSATLKTPIQRPSVKRASEYARRRELAIGEKPVTPVDAIRMSEQSSVKRTMSSGARPEMSRISENERRMQRTKSETSAMQRKAEAKKEIGTHDLEALLMDSTQAGTHTYGISSAGAGASGQEYIVDETSHYRTMSSPRAPRPVSNGSSILAYDDLSTFEEPSEYL